MKKISNIIWGIILIAAGVVFALNSLGITDIDVLFAGWWTLFIIVPCAVGLFTEREKTGNLIGLGIGVLLLLCCQQVLEFSLLWKVLVPGIVVVIGLKLLLSGIVGNRAKEMIAGMKEEGKNLKKACAAFSGYDINYSGEEFDGAELTAVFGGINCDLRGAVIEKDCAIRVTVVFGGVDIFVPDNVNVKVDSTCIFGGVSNQTTSYPNAPTVYISGPCLFGGVDVK